jgi:predicted metal-dependent phosphoesterase TrpH
MTDPSNVSVIVPFDGQPGEWLRCAFHVHTTKSDGWLQPHVQRQYHAWGGYDVLFITDHDGFTPEPDGDDAVLVIGGTELSLTAPKSGGPLHLLGIGVTAKVDIDRDATLLDAATAVRATGGLPFLAHPVWSGLRTDEVDGIESCAGVEIFNAGCDVEQGRGHNDAHADIWLSMGHRLNLIATDDTHYPGYDAFRAWVLVHAAERSREAVLDALANGRFYSTTGPRITDLSFDGGILTVRTTPVRAIAALSNPPHGGQVTAGHHALTYRGERLRTKDDQAWEGIVDGDLLTGARFPIRPGMRYLRIVLTDDHGRKAWSNPIWIDQES